jgi:dipeptide/tripeptide permease
MSDTNFDQLRTRHRVRTARRRITVVIGFILLAAGYALLAVSPTTSSEWALIRVFAGFALLFIGFGLAILPLLSRLTSGDDD